MNINDVVVCDPDILAGTRVPVATVIDYTAAGGSIDDFLTGFSGVHMQQVIAYLEEVREHTRDAA